MTNQAKVFVDYAHNGDSLEKLLSVVEEYQKGQIYLILGAPGNKGESRRADFGQVINQHPNVRIILTADDPNFEDPQLISEEIASYIHREVDISLTVKKQSRLVWSAVRMSRMHSLLLARGLMLIRLSRDKRLPMQVI